MMKMAGDGPDHIAAHDYCKSNRENLSKSEVCGCFHCLDVYDPSEIFEWIHDKNGDTAFCPKCGIDSVIGSASGYPIEMEFLSRMKKYWF